MARSPDLPILRSLVLPILQAFHRFKGNRIPGISLEACLILIQRFVGPALRFQDSSQTEVCTAVESVQYHRLSEGVLGVLPAVPATVDFTQRIPGLSRTSTRYGAAKLLLRLREPP